MKHKDLWGYFWKTKVAYIKPFDRYFIWVKKEDFEKVSNSFIKDFNPRHKDKSFRSNSYFFHIHAIDQDEYILLHKDFGNLDKFWPLAIIHILVDFLPYIIFTRIKGVSLRHYDKCPLVK